MKICLINIVLQAKDLNKKSTSQMACRLLSFCNKIFNPLAVVLLGFSNLIERRIEKKKYREIAEMLGISQKAVEKRMHQAMLHLRSKIKNYKI